MSGEVKRYNYIEADGIEGIGWIEGGEKGVFVTHDDYASLHTRLEEAEAQRDKAINEYLHREAAQINKRLEEAERKQEENYKRYCEADHECEYLYFDLARLRRETVETLNSLRWPHLEVEDSWYSCPKSVAGCINEALVGCNCGADEYNAKIDALVARLSREKGESHTVG